MIEHWRLHGRRRSQEAGRHSRASFLHAEDAPKVQVALQRVDVRVPTERQQRLDWDAILGHRLKRSTSDGSSGERLLGVGRCRAKVGAHDRCELRDRVAEQRRRLREELQLADALVEVGLQFLIVIRTEVCVDAVRATSRDDLAAPNRDLDVIFYFNTRTRIELI